jgi:UDP-N-acetylmuramate--alanine ligase
LALALAVRPRYILIMALRYHFSGIAGAGMNPLAQLMRAWGHEVQGSDRSFDQGKALELAGRLRAQGIELLAQDGAAITSGIGRFVYSAAVEQDTPEMRAARALGLEMIPRPALLAEVVDRATPGVAVAGTSGKSTVTGMISWILRAAGVEATILGGAALAGEGGAGGFCAGARGAALIAEACESDGTLVGYHPAIGVVHNITRDHAEVGELHRQFDAFARQSRTVLVNAGCPEALKAVAGHQRLVRYGLGALAELPLEVLGAGPWRARGVLGLPEGELLIDLPQPGSHNLENAAAAAACARELGVPLAVIASALSGFPGVSRRFEVVGTTESGIRVIDDYAHNGGKIRAAVQAAQAGCERLIAVFQPHGYGPARFLRPELRELLPGLLRPADRFCYSEIFYSGGTVAKDISSRDLAADLPAGLSCGYAADHQELLGWISGQAMPGDTVLLMGARDPELPRLARAVHDLL